MRCAAEVVAFGGRGEKSGEGKQLWLQDNDPTSDNAPESIRRRGVVGAMVDRFGRSPDYVLEWWKRRCG